MYFAIFVGLIMISSGFGLLFALPVIGADDVQPVINGIPDPVKPRAVPRVVLTEDFTNTACGPCAGHNPAWTAAINTLGFDVVAPAYVHVWWPSGADPFYLADTAGITARVNYYGVSGVPDAFMDGQDIATHQGQAAYEAAWSARAAIPADAMITSTGQLDDISDSGTIDIHVEAVENLPAGDYRLYVYLWETDYTIGAPYPNGENVLDWAVYKYLPSGNGDPIASWAGGAGIGAFEDFNYIFDLPTWAYNVDNIGATIFIQDHNVAPHGNTNVVQAHVQTFDNLPPSVVLNDNNGQAEDGTWHGTETVAWFGDDPNEPPATLDTHIEYSPNAGGNWFTLENGVDNNDGMYTWDTTTVADGNDYLLRVTVVDDFLEVATDTSDAVFTIDNTPFIDVTYPDGGQLWMGGTFHRVWWNMSDFADALEQLTVNLYYSTDSGATFPFTIATGLTGFLPGPNTPHYDWNPLPSIDTTQLRVRAEVVDTDAVTDEDDTLGDVEIDSTPALPTSNANAELVSTHVVVSWDPSPSADVDHYEVWFRMNNDMDPTGATYAYSGSTTGLTYQHSNVGINSPGSYFYQVRTIDQVGHSTSAWRQAGKIGSMQSALANPSGWFMLGSALVQSDTSLAHVIQGTGLPGAYDYIQSYDAFDAGDPWKSYMVTRPVNDLTGIGYEQGFWMHVTGNTRWATAGYVTDQSVPMKAGWNLVPFPFAARSRTAAQVDADLSANCPGYVSMMIMDSAADYRIVTPGGGEVVQNSHGIWVNVNADSTWTVTNY